jgi:AcrR family transcriptional regulator
MAESTKTVKRRYRSPVRDESAAETRRAILRAAYQLFTKRGYDAMTMQAVAKRAKVAVDTVYEVVGRKPLLARLLVESAISNRDRAVDAEERDYVRRIREAVGARAKLTCYAEAVVDIHGRLAPLVRALHAAAPGHPELARLWREISERRAANMRLFAAELLATGEVRRGLGRDRIADAVWTLAAAEVYLLLVEQRGWSPEEVGEWLADTWIRMFLRRSGDRTGILHTRVDHLPRRGQDRSVRRR